MSYSVTPNLGLLKPTNRNDIDQWGTHVNTDMDILDTNATGLQSQIDAIETSIAALTGLTSVATIAALRALTIATTKDAMYVDGYYAPGDGGEGMFVQVPANTTSADNGGTIIVDAASRRWYRAGAQAGATDKQFGCKVDGSTDDTVCLQAAVTALQATGRGPLTLAGGIRIVSATINITAPLIIQGVGTGAGPGVMTTNGASVVMCAAAFTAGDVFYAQSSYPFVFRDFQIAGAPGLSFTSASPRTAGAGIHIAGLTATTNTASVIRNVAFSGMFRGIYLERCQENTYTEDCYHQAWKEAAFYAGNGPSGVECSCGHVTRNQYFGNGAAQASGMEIHCGYGDITANKFLGGTYGLQVHADQGVNIGSLIIALNSFEEVAYISLFVTTMTPLEASIQIVSNQFSNINVQTLGSHIAVQPDTGGGGNEIFNVDITGNNFFTQTTAAQASFIAANFLNGTISRNKGRLVGGSAYGVVVPAGADQTMQILDNEWTAAGGTLTNPTGYFLQGVPIIRDTSTRAFTVALLPVNAANGSQLYCTDGHAPSLSTGNFTVTAGGSGCIAFRMQGQWLTFAG